MSTFQETLIERLEAAGWYFDWKHVEEDLTWYSERERGDVLRTAHAWTVPQWGEYWSSDHLAPVGPKPKRRRYESLQEALWSQLLREEEPETYACFFALDTDKKTD